MTTTTTRAIEFDEAVPVRATAKAARTGGKPLRGHRYHELSDDSLRFIMRDAGECARLARNDWKDAAAEGKYLDQVNDARSILGWRMRTRRAK